MRRVGRLGGAIGGRRREGAAATPVPSFNVPADIEKELFMYNWGDYVDPDNIALFQSSHGVDKFTYDTFASNDELMTKLQGGAIGQWDVSAPTAEFVPAMAEQGFIQKIDFSRVPNAKNVDKEFKGIWWDPNDEWQVPKDWGTTGIARPDQGRRTRKSTPGSSSSRSPRSIPAGSSSWTRPVTSSRRHSRRSATR